MKRLWILAAAGLLPAAGWAKGFSRFESTGSRLDLWRFGASFSVTSGDYGTDQRTSSWYLPFTARRLFDSGHLEIVLPLTSLTTYGQVTVVGGKPRRSGTARGATRTESVTETGLGDILLRGRWHAVEEQEQVPEVDLTARVKFPTASESRGLGTGEFDESLGIDLAKGVAEDWDVFGGLGYTFIGNPPEAALRDAWNYSLGFGRRLREDLSASASYEESRALVEGNDNPRDLFLGLSWRAKTDVSLQGSVQFGLSDGSPDVGFTAGVMAKFPS